MRPAWIVFFFIGGAIGAEGRNKGGEVETLNWRAVQEQIELKFGEFYESPKG